MSGFGLAGGLGCVAAGVARSSFRFSLSFARTQLSRYRWFCVEAALLSILVRVLIHSGRRFLSLSVFLFFLSLSTILIGFSFSMSLPLLPYASLFLLWVSLCLIAFWPFFVSFASSLAAPCLARSCAATPKLHTQETSIHDALAA